MLVAITGFAFAGLPRLTFSDDYREIFRSTDDAFLLFEEVSESFTSDDRLVMVLVEAEDVFELEVVKIWDRLQAELASLEGVVQVVTPLRVSGLGRLLAETADSETRQRLREAIDRHPLLAGCLVTSDLSAGLAVVELDDSSSSLDEVQPLIAKIEQFASRNRSDGVSIRHTGIPSIRLETVRGVQRDQILFTLVGLSLGSVVAWLAFGHLLPALVVGAGPITGLIWTLGAIGWIGEPINVLNNVVAVLVLVIGMTDSVHLVRSFQEQRGDGAGSAGAALAALRRVGPACLLTTATTVAGFLSLGVAESRMVRVFGLTCSLGLVLSFLAVTSVTTLINAGPMGQRMPGQRFRSFGGAWTVWLAARSRLISGIGIVLLVATSSAFLILEPDYRYREYLPRDSPVLESLDAMESKFGGSFPLHVVVDWEEGTSAEEILGTLAEVEDLLVDTPGVTHPHSITGLMAALAGDPLDPGAVAAVPDAFRQNLYRPDLRRALVTGRLGETAASVLTPRLEDLGARLSALDDERPGLTLRLSGMAHVASRKSLEMISQLVVSLALAAVVIVVLLCVALRSLWWGLLSLLPNLLPLGAIGAVLALTDRPLQFSSVTLLSVVLGLAVDDTIHLLMDLRRRGSTGRSPVDQVADSLASVGPALATTSALLIVGFGSVALSRAPMMSLFGWLGCIALAVSLLADLAFLPALVLARGTRQPS